MVRKEILIQPERGKYEITQQQVTDGEFIEGTNTIQEIVMDLFTQSTVIQEQYLIDLLEKKGYSKKESEEELQKGKTTGLWYEETPGKIKKI